MFVELCGLDEEDWFEILRVRPNKGIRVIFFLLEPALSLVVDDGVILSISPLCEAEATLRKSLEMSDATVRRC
jgi:hypothetical protein